MIKVAISGAETPEAGELIRILVNHPDVEIVALVSPGNEGRLVQNVHHGLLGEEKITFTGVFRPEGVDLLFVTNPSITIDDLRKLRETFPELKIIAFSHISAPADEEKEQIVFALPEINRKLLVRGARTAVIPSPLTSLALVPLYPLALNLLLSSDISLQISAPQDIIRQEDIERAQEEIANRLADAQKSFAGKISISPLPPTSKRGIELTAEIACPLDMEHLARVFGIYDDHNFSFAIMNPVKLDDVKGTEKCIVSLSRTKDDRLHIHAVADGRLRGSAGEAVHVMNLLFGLHEKTGLYLKPYAF